MLNRSTAALPSTITNRAAFSLYYPSPMPAGYTYRKDSANFENDIVFYILQNNNQTVFVSEQAIPTAPPDINNLLGFKSLTTPAGNAAVGLVGGRPTAILLSNTTLITITGSGNTPKDTIAALTTNMQLTSQH